MSTLCRGGGVCTTECIWVSLCTFAGSCICATKSGYVDVCVSCIQKQLCRRELTWGWGRWGGERLVALSLPLLPQCLGKWGEAGHTTTFPGARLGVVGGMSLLWLGTSAWLGAAEAWQTSKSLRCRRGRLDVGVDRHLGGFG